ncbi:hypothetical protein OKA05_12275 [Luteolibacter arcticus]|uniref:Uncharacterized protein n=1 Tax=Luteolibacter arcticus TaxID=1581411 RepID=A0ABT3GIJ5_9BACT|nr:hypothetical protein [Luteolibacter arcticus]MCW1923332.1 hypothetical protein [Luteolibacter arcticus]
MKALTLGLIWWCIIALAPAHAQVVPSDPWANLETVKEFVVGPEKHDVKQGPRLRIQLLEPAPIYGSGGGPGWITDENENLDVWQMDVGDHAFLFTSQLDLFIDNLYAGKCKPNDDVRYGHGRLWVNGVPRLLVEPSKKQKHLVIEDPEDPQPEGGLVDEELWKIYVKPFGSSGGRGTEGTRTIITNGMTVIRVWNNWFHLHGVNYGRVNPGDEIRVRDGRVSINGKVRHPASPQPDASKAAAPVEKSVSPPAKPEGH